MEFQLRAEYGVESGVRWHVAPEATGEALCGVWLSPIAGTRPATDLLVLRADRDEVCFACLVAHREQAGQRRYEEAREETGLPSRGTPDGPLPGRRTTPQAGAPRDR